MAKSSIFVAGPFWKLTRARGVENLVYGSRGPFSNKTSIVEFRRDNLFIFGGNDRFRSGSSGEVWSSTTKVFIKVEEV
jgi:hypothetical protein